MPKQTVEIEVPNGYEFVGMQVPKKGDWLQTKDGEMWEVVSGFESFVAPVYRKIELPDPGEGWRLLDDDECVQFYDEYCKPRMGIWRQFGDFKPDLVGHPVSALRRYSGWSNTSVRRKVIKYRPFANAEEFVLHRDRWVTLTDPAGDPNWRACVAYYNDTICVFANSPNQYSWAEALKSYKFDDGTPFGVEDVS